MFNAAASVSAALLHYELVVRGINGFNEDPVVWLAHYERLKKRAPRRLSALEKRIVGERDGSEWIDRLTTLAKLIDVDAPMLLLYLLKRHNMKLELL